MIKINLHDDAFTGGHVDYTSGPYTVTFPAGETHVTFKVSITNDIIMEENENFNLTIDPSSLSSDITVINQATVTIVDDDGMSISKGLLLVIYWF